MMTKYLWTIIAIMIGCYVFFAVFFILQRLYFPPKIYQSPIKIQTASNKTEAQKQITNNAQTEEPDIQLQEHEGAIEAIVQDRNILFNVPFASQAPLGNWDDPVFQNGCEEASVFMAMLWVEGKQTTAKDVEKAILALSNFEQKKYGNFLDTSAADTARLIQDYFGYQNVSVKSNINIDDIKTELWDGNLVIVPVNGRKLKNPFYTPPGPERHMLVIIGYDSQNKTFITNDPGTRRGKTFQYPEHVLGEALRDYETGYHEPIKEIKKVMIVVEPSAKKP